ncbi:MAG: short-chain dehydrogenase [Hirschia sp.]|nr:short-chain dehydrogenase [Hirschia sp.]MBF17617.1 short-chain dehydrogenase [Hirschia sp.]
MGDSSSNLVVLGAAAGVGGQCARAFTRAGWTCFIADSDVRALEDLQDELKEKIGHYAGDLDTTLGLRNVMAGAMATFNRIDAVVHIPNIPEGGGLLDSEAAYFEESVVAPARSVTAAMRMFAAQMIEQRKQEEQDELEATPRANCFVQILSMAAVAADRRRYIQSASQSLALAAAQSATLELSDVRIRTNAIIAIRPRAEREEEGWLAERTPLGRACHAEEIAQTALFLSSPAAANMTGQTVTLDGGRSRLNGVMKHESIDQPR